MPDMAVELPVVYWQSIRLLIGRSLVQAQPQEPDKNPELRFRVLLPAPELLYQGIIHKGCRSRRSPRHYTVLIPMDDGNWHVTVYCPASLDGPLLDKDSNEFDTDDVKPGDKSYTVANPFHLDHAPGTDGFIFGPDTLRR